MCVCVHVYGHHQNDSYSNICQPDPQLTKINGIQVIQGPCFHFRDLKSCARCAHHVHRALKPSRCARSKASCP